jgi:site-specific DNA-methyltransferase (adenine-specific)
MSSTKTAPRNKTIHLTKSEEKELLKKTVKLKNSVSVDKITNKTIHQDFFEAVEFLPDGFIDLLFIDPPYNMNKNFGTKSFKQSSVAEYTEWLDSVIAELDRCLKPTASVYICGDWRSSTSIHQVMEKYFIVRNRITWEREKGRGAKTNWKMNSEDIWFGTKSKKYFYNVDAVKLKRRVIAPYRTEDGKPKDWDETENGQFRLTFPSNLWTDISVPFWSMPENTEHPTQKPEKLLAKIILAGSRKDDFVFDPFLGSGTTSVVAKKTGRKYSGIEADSYFAALAEKRLLMADKNKTIQGYSNGVFWERNAKNFTKTANNV